MLFLVASLLFGLLGGVIARRKGNSFLLWFVIAAIPPYIGVLVAIVYRSERDEPQRACPTCGNVVPYSDALCTRCGSELEFPGALPGSDPATVH
jgi:predicted nucleic acid-binding Zn ribbon protein